MVGYLWSVSSIKKKSQNTKTNGIIEYKKS